jgi:hypothetical protein
MFPPVREAPVLSPQSMPGDGGRRVGTTQLIIFLAGRPRRRYGGGAWGRTCPPLLCGFALDSLNLHLPNQSQITDIRVSAYQNIVLVIIFEVFLMGIPIFQFREKLLHAMTS